MVKYKQAYKNWLTKYWMQNIDQRSDGGQEYRLGYLYYGFLGRESSTKHLLMGNT